MDRRMVTVKANSERLKKQKIRKRNGGVPYDSVGDWTNHDS